MTFPEKIEGLRDRLKNAEKSLSMITKHLKNSPGLIHSVTLGLNPAGRWELWIDGEEIGHYETRSLALINLVRVADDQW